MNAKHDEVVRGIEESVLDQHHLNYPLLIRSERRAIFAILNEISVIIRGLRTGKIAKTSDDGRSETINQGLRGLAHCLRWIKTLCSVEDERQIADENSLSNEAMTLLRWSVKYDVLFNQHTAYSRNVGGRRLVEAEVNEAERVITFSSIFSGSHRYFVSQVESKKRNDEREAQLSPEPELSQRSKPWFASAKPSVTGLQFDYATIRSGGALQVAESWLESTFFPGIRSQVSLGDFTVGELRRVLGFVHVYSLFRTRLEDFADDRGQVVLLPSVVQTEAAQFALEISDATDVEVSKVSAILEIYTFVVKPLRITCAQKPFVKTNDGCMMFVPRVFLSLNLEHMFIGAVNVTVAGQKAYSNAINTIESSGVEAISAHLGNTGMQCCQRQKQVSWCLSNGDVITPDIVLLSQDGKEALIIDVKHSCPPFGPADIHSDLEDMEKWKSRMAEYVAAFSENPNIFAQHFQISKGMRPQVMGMILMRWPFPIPTEFSPPIVCIDWPSLRDRLNTLSGTHSISDIFLWVHGRPDVPIVDKLQPVQKEVRVADWTYRYSVFSQ
ncbi:MAG: hypothetical protein JNL58_31750 [Planctomyces sp.]|nr:hypothetical protein [Planctomyces sp.]